MAMEAQSSIGQWTWLIGFILAAFKTLLIPAYRSTDFEVHRNWLAITHSLPLKDWYYESTSEWTLDYPPFFAYFEYLLSHLAALADPEMVKVKNRNYASSATVVFQRLSVIAVDFLLIYATAEFCKMRFAQLLSRSRNSTQSGADRVSSLKKSQLVVAVLLTTNFGLFLVDHLHFQYNGFLFGVLILSITRVYQRRHVEAAFFFASLLNLKHIFAYLIPAFVVYLFKVTFTQYDGRGRVVVGSFSPIKLATIGAPVVLTLLLSFGPFLPHLPQVMSRLFPFKRGLCHAYWAPNFWALYNLADKVIATFLRLVGVELPVETASMSGGLVQEFRHAALMPVTPPATFVLTLAAMAPALVNLWRSYPTPQRFVRILVLCAFASFVFGWHVHEKAVLMMIVPLSLLALDTFEDKRLFFLLATTGHFSLFPLIFTPAEAPIKILLFTLFTGTSFHFLNQNILPSSSSNQPLLDFKETIYILGMILIQIYVGIGHWALGLDHKLPFLPLLIMSCYCTIGILYVWIRFYHHTIMLPL